MTAGFASGKKVLFSPSPESVFSICCVQKACVCMHRTCFPPLPTTYACFAQKKIVRFSAFQEISASQTKDGGVISLFCGHFVFVHGEIFFLTSPNFTAALKSARQYTVQQKAAGKLENSCVHICTCVYVNCRKNEIIPAATPFRIFRILQENGGKVMCVSRLLLSVNFSPGNDSGAQKPLHSSSSLFPHSYAEDRKDNNGEIVRKRRKKRKRKLLFS